MKERGTIFNSEMVRAILDGRKTQTRRIMKPQPTPCNYVDERGKARGGHQWPSNIFRTMLHVEGELQNGDGGWKGLVGGACPFGDIGDRLWVRETFALLGNEDGVCVDWNDRIVYDEEEAARIYRASCEQKDGDYGLWSIPDDADWKPHTDNHKYDGTWRPSIHMPRWASRILLEITGVRVERLQDISGEDAVAEGVVTGSYGNEGNWMNGFYAPGGNQPHQTAKSAYSELWCSIYGADAWYKNPWVWVIEFTQIQRGN
ncbi:hypothetical protein [Morganella morganii]|uniref:hypothetical protein n=1 Tax=Morganella morganii TaxID=582 RepID=UPI000D58F46B|nr:hypothetical protein [Morganella morganii]